MNIPLTVWLSAIVVSVFSAYSAWQNPALWFQCLGIVIFIVSLMRLIYFVIERK